MNAKTIEDQLIIRQAFADSCRGTLYHYTNAEGFRGIIDKHEIWMTNTAFLNDPTECKLLSNEKDLFAGAVLSNEHVKQAWDEFVKNFADKDRSDYYLASFSKIRDLLEQWRAYGNFCIGFDAKKLSNLKSRVKLYECVYDKQTIKKWILRKEKVNEWKNKVTEAKKNAAGDLLFSAKLKYKDKNYQREKEVRLITVSSSNNWFPNSPKPPGQLPIHFRDHKAYALPLPYVKFFITKDGQHKTGTKETGKEINQRKLNDGGETERDVLPITEVMIGPMTPHQKEAKTACEIFLFERGYNVPINTSKIPYRGF
jgi:hypothetical protein